MFICKDRVIRWVRPAAVLALYLFTNAAPARATDPPSDGSFADPAARKIVSETAARLQELDAKHDYPAMLALIESAGKSVSGEAKLALESFVPFVLAEQGRSDEGVKALAALYFKVQTLPEKQLIINRLASSDTVKGMHTFACDATTQILAIEDDKVHNLRAQLQAIRIRAAAFADGNVDRALQMAREAAAEPSDRKGASNVLTDLWSFFSRPVDNKAPAAAVRALEIMDRSQEICPELLDQPTYLLNRGAMLYGAGHWQASFDTYLKVVSDSEDDDPTLTRACWGAAVAAIKIGRPEISDAFFDKCLKASQSWAGGLEYRKQIAIQRQIERGVAGSDGAPVSSHSSSPVTVLPDPTRPVPSSGKVGAQ